MQGSEVDLSKLYDAIIIGSGAAGGMAAHVLTSHGLQVLLLEAGKKLDIEQELRSMEWPYENRFRGVLPPDSHALTLNEYTIRNPPYGPGFEKYKHLYTDGADAYNKNILVDERDHPFTGTNYDWLRARCLGGKTNIWGRLALRLSDYDFKAKSRDGHGEDWPISYSDIASYYDKVDLYLGIEGVAEHLPHLPDSLFQRPHKLNCAEVKLKHSIQKMDRVLTQYRAGVTTDGLKHNKYRTRCFGRGACGRRGGGCDIHAAFDSPTGLIYPAMDTGNLTLRTNAIVREVTVDLRTGKANGIHFVDSETMKDYNARARVIVLAASTLESARILLLSKSQIYPNGLANSSGHVGHNFCEHVMGPAIVGQMSELVDKPATLDDGRPGGFYIPRFRNLSEKHPRFIRGYGFEGGSGCTMFPRGIRAEGFGALYKEAIRKNYGSFIEMGGFGEVLARYENYVDLDPAVKDKWGIPALRFHYKFRDNEKRMVADMADSAQEMFEAAGFKVLQVDRGMLLEGSSIHELGTARMGLDPKTSVLNQFQQSHDVKNLFVVDGSGFVSAGCQNPTWTIMALCWRSCDYLAQELRMGNL